MILVEEKAQIKHSRSLRFVLVDSMVSKSLIWERVTVEQMCGQACEDQKRLMDPTV